MDFTTKHSAPGQMFGYLFQPDRALYWLAKSKKSSSVSIETFDDIVVHDENGKIVKLEQVKTTIMQNHETFLGRSKSLWNTLFIWLELINKNEINLENTEFYFATNVKLHKKSLAMQIAKANDAAKVSAAMQILRAINQNPPAGIKEFAQHVLQNENLLRKLIFKINICDKRDYNSFDSEICSILNVSQSIEEDVLRYLKGWIHESILNLWEINKPAILSKTQFTEVLNKAISRFYDKQLITRARDLVDVKKENIEECKYNIFVQQLELFLEEDSISTEIILDAINDFLKAKEERIKITLDGTVTKDDFKAFDARLIERWKVFFRKHCRKVSDELSNEELRELAYQIFSDTIDNYCEMLAGQPTIEPYLTKGTYHSLANKPVIGWHPYWKKYFIQKTK